MSSAECKLSEWDMETICDDLHIYHHLWIHLSTYIILYEMSLLIEYCHWVPCDICYSLVTLGCWQSLFFQWLFNVSPILVPANNFAKILKSCLCDCRSKYMWPDDCCIYHTCSMKPWRATTMLIGLPPVCSYTYMFLKLRVKTNIYFFFHWTIIFICINAFFYSTILFNPYIMYIWF